MDKNLDDVYVVCVYKSGGDFTREYVDELYKGVMKFSSLKRNQFICLTDCLDEFYDEPFGVYPLIHDLNGWWSKLEIFGEYMFTIVYFDLDTIIRGQIDPLLSYPHEFTMLRDVAGVDRPASGVMAWNGNYKYLLDKVLEDRSIIDKYTPSKGGKLGDQAYIADHLGFKPLYIQDIFKSFVSSYKLSSEAERQASSIVCYHGKPRPHETGWSA